MLISPQRLRKWFGIAPTGVLHVGAHLAEEFPDYQEARFGPTIWVEAQSDLLPRIQEVIQGSGDSLIEAVAWSETGQELTFQVTNETQSSSVYELADHLAEYPQIQRAEERAVRTVRLDEVIPAGAQFDFVTLDIQGAELEALRGMGSLLSNVRWIFSEVNRREMYGGIPLVDELDTFLSRWGFRRVVTLWNQAGWGDALYLTPPESFVGRLRIFIAANAAVLHFHGQTKVAQFRKKIIKIKRRAYRFIDQIRGIS